MYLHTSSLYQICLIGAFHFSFPLFLDLPLPRENFDLILKTRENTQNKWRRTRTFLGGFFFSQAHTHGP